MADAQITCIQKLNLNSPHEHITHVGNPPQWVWTREAVVESIKAGSNTFYVLDALTRKRSEVGVVEESGKKPYLRTYADGYYNNNLLSLNQCSYK
jgi:Protein of unknown function (DUF3892)